MERNELKEQIDKTVQLIKNNSKDARFADKLIDKLLSLKGQYDVEPAWCHFPVTDKDEVIDTGGAYKIVRNSHGVNFHITGFDFTLLKDGSNVSIKNYLKTAHCPFDRLFELWAKRNEGTLTKEEEAEYGTLLVATVAMCQIMVVASTSEQRQALLTILTDEWYKEISEALEADLQEETPNADAEFENMNEALKEIGGKDA